MHSEAPTSILEDYLAQYLTPVYIAVATMAVGILFGVLAVGTLTPADKLSLVGYLRHFIDIQTSTPTYHGVFRQALTANLKLLGLLYLLGVSVAGMPLVMVALFFRGFVLGFSAAFVLMSFHWQGAGLAAITMGLQNVFIVPAIVIVGGVALGFSWQLISTKGRAARSTLSQRFAAFTTLVVAMSFVVLVGTALEAYAAPFLMHLLSGWGI
ncbi:MAG: stage II sporulation protein M [Sulfobacillus thermosulfidooxidans]|uniref:Stage II sporulation protein M n=1 Tax=Sulfobacillus thermotolerans TaxID=338644 RepID=A0ABN5GZH5_9FIRM|nr:stage II sporulation protein M [Sulfobacillus sp. hq2]AUW93539.1 stage II sporulation protein M [Sulfobacillus thermotolerans]MCY0907895.1 stage II sporulation protein M [Sulfobacillus thermotolerans]POB10783.1 stage II sporulation protein M [Sulfobacillus sp. hq2]PSR36895.1 MAG: stage II sporulation protein M [Sulfobacillus thermosulfidooxidans]